MPIELFCESRIDALIVRVDLNHGLAFDSSRLAIGLCNNAT